MLLHQIFIWLFLLYFSTLRGNYFSLKPCFTCSCEIISKLTADVCLCPCIVSCKESLWCLFFIVYSWIPCKKKKKLLKWHFISELLDCMLICFHLTYLLFLLFPKLVWILIFLEDHCLSAQGTVSPRGTGCGVCVPFTRSVTTPSCCAGCCLLMTWIMRVLFITTVCSV